MQIGEKIKEFGLKKFGSITRFASELNMKPQGLYEYISKGVMPGAEFLMQLKRMGCDMNWLLDEEDNSALVIKEPSVKYKINTLELENERLRDENEHLKNSIASTIITLQEQIKPRKKNITDKWKKLL